MFVGANSTGKNTRRDEELPRLVTQDSEIKMEDKLKQTGRPINDDGDMKRR